MTAKETLYAALESYGWSNASTIGMAEDAILHAMEMHQGRFNCQDHSVYFDEFANINTQKYCSKKVNTTSRNTGYLGLTIALTPILNEDPKAFAKRKQEVRDRGLSKMMEIINHLADEDQLRGGYLVKLMTMPLARLSPEDRVMVLSYLEFRTAPATVNQVLQDSGIIGLEDEIANKEGELPQYIVK